MPPPRLGDVRAEDLKDTGRLLTLLGQAIGRNLVGGSEADRFRFVAAAEHARSAGTRNPCGLFARLVRRGWWHFATQGDEDAASARLKRDLFAARLPACGVPRPEFAAPPRLSADAELVSAVRAALRPRRGLPRPVPGVFGAEPGLDPAALGRRAGRGTGGAVRALTAREGRGRPGPTAGRSTSRRARWFVSVEARRRDLGR